jgi:hypothetical protein
MLSRDTEGFYYTFEELTNQKVAFSDLVHKLAGLNRSDVLMWIAGLSEFLQRRSSRSRSTGCTRAVALIIQFVEKGKFPERNPLTEIL